MVVDVSVGEDRLGLQRSADMATGIHWRPAAVACQNEVSKDFITIGHEGDLKSFAFCDKLPPRTFYRDAGSVDGSSEQDASGFPLQ